MEAGGSLADASLTAPDIRLLEISRLCNPPEAKEGGGGGGEEPSLLGGEPREEGQGEEKREEDTEEEEDSDEEDSEEDAPLWEPGGKEPPEAPNPHLHPVTI